MKKSNLRVMFYILKSRTLKNGNTPIIMRITINGQDEDIRIMRSIPINSWDNKKYRAKGRTYSANELNDYISSLETRSREIHAELLLGNSYISPKAIISRLFSNDEVRTVIATMLEEIEEMKKLIGIDYEKVTINRYENCTRAVAKVIKTYYRKEDISFHELNGEFIRRLDTFLKVEKGLSTNTLVRYMKCFKKITNLAAANNWLKSDPFAGIKYKQPETNPTFLTLDEVSAISAKEIHMERMSVARDVFLFCCFTGLAFIDVKELKPEHITHDNEGNPWIRKSRNKQQKSNARSCMCNIPILQPALKILGKYSDHPMCRKNGTCLPVYCNQTMNSYLKEIAEICGIHKNLTTHVARHTFATTIALANKVSLQNVSKMLGHTSTRMTEHYARVMDESIMEDMKKVESKLLAKVH